MTRGLFAIASLLFSSLAYCVDDPHWVERKRIWQTNPGCRPDQNNTCGADLGHVNKALHSPEDLWKFITSPGTNYFDRRVAASRAGRIVPPEWLPRLLAVRHELQTESHLHQFGVAPHPLDMGASLFGFYWSIARPPGASSPAPAIVTPESSVQTSPRLHVGTQIDRTILGHAFMVPAVWTDFPITDEEQRRSPWPFQLSLAVDDLYRAVLREGDPGRIVPVAMTLPCVDYPTARELISLTEEVVRIRRYLSPEFFGIWLNAAMNPKTYQAVVSIPGTIGLAYKENPEAWAMMQVLGLEGLKNPSSLVRAVIDAIQFVRPIPYSVALAAARYLAASRDTAWNRAYEENILLGGIGEPRLAVLNTFEEKDIVEYERITVAFQAWLKENEAVLAEKARAESPRIEAARRKMSAVTTCRQ